MLENVAYMLAQKKTVLHTLVADKRLLNNMAQEIRSTLYHFVINKTANKTVLTQAAAEYEGCV